MTSENLEILLAPCFQVDTCWKSNPHDHDRFYNARHNVFTETGGKIDEQQFKETITNLIAKNKVSIDKNLQSQRIDELCRTAVTISEYLCANNESN